MYPRSLRMAAAPMRILMALEPCSLSEVPLGRVHVGDHPDQGGVGADSQISSQQARAARRRGPQCHFRSRRGRHGPAAHQERGSAPVSTCRSLSSSHAPKRFGFPNERGSRARGGADQAPEKCEPVWRVRGGRIWQRGSSRRNDCELGPVEFGQPTVVQRGDVQTAIWASLEKRPCLHDARERHRVRDRRLAVPSGIATCTSIPASTRERGSDEPPTWLLSES